MAFSTKKPVLRVGTQSGEIDQYETTGSYTRIGSVPGQSPGSHLCSVLFPNSDLFALSVNVENTARVDLPTGRRVKLSDVGLNSVACLSPIGDSILGIQGISPQLRSVNTFTGNSHSIALGRSRRPVAMTESVDGKTAYISFQNGEIDAINLDSGRLSWEKASHQGVAERLAVFPDGQTILSGGQDGSLCLWDVNAGTLLRTLYTDAGPISQIAISVDGSLLLVSGSSSREVYKWDLSDVARTNDP